jgi:hypothetical protein
MDPFRRRAVIYFKATMAGGVIDWDTGRVKYPRRD